MAEEPQESWGTRVGRELDGVGKGLSRVVEVWAARLEMRGRRAVAVGVVTAVAGVAIVAMTVVGVWMLMAGLAEWVGEVSGRGWLGQVVVGGLGMGAALIWAWVVGQQVVKSGERGIRKRFEERDVEEAAEREAR